MEADNFFRILEDVARLVSLVDAHWEAVREATVHRSCELCASREPMLSLAASGIHLTAKHLPGLLVS